MNVTSIISVKFEKIDEATRMRTREQANSRTIDA
jgi:hypothetical protein